MEETLKLNKAPAKAMRKGADLDKTFEIILKVLGVLLGCIYMCATLSAPYMEDSYYSLLMSCPSRVSQIILPIVKYLANAAVLIAIPSAFFKFRCTDRIVRYFVPFIVLIRFILFKTLVLVDTGANLFDVETKRILLIEIILLLEQGALAAISILTWVRFAFNKNKEKSTKPLWDQILTPVLLVILVGAIAMPNSFLLGIFGPSYTAAIDFSFQHRLLLYSAFIVPFIVMMVFRNRPYEVRWYICLQAAMAGFYVFFRRDAFITFTEVTNLPLHICNTGVIVMLIAFIFRSKPAFYFSYLINVLGATFACLMPNKTGDLFYSGSIGFWHNHLADICIPLTAVGLKVFERPKFKYVGYSLIAFTCYFLLVAALDGYYHEMGLDYFFLNSTKFTDVVDNTDFLRTDFLFYIPLGKGEIQVRWLYWIIIYVVYCALATGVWILFSLVFRISDKHLDLHYKVVKNRELAKERKALLTKKTEEKAMIEISHLTKIYGGSTQKAVNDFSLTVEPGEVYGFLGHNGAGKSTLIKCLTGIQPITDGTIKVFGKDIKVEPKEVKRLIGYVPDNHAVYEGLTGREYVNYIADLYMVSTKERKERLDKYAGMFKISQALDKQIKDYSHGMKQKITIIAALIHNPKVWILDEPLTGLDPYSIYQIKQCMKEHAKAGNIVFFSSHVIDVVENVCTRICIISHGEKQYEAKISDLKRKGVKLEDIYLKYVANFDSK